MEERGGGRGDTPKMRGPTVAGGPTGSRGTAPRGRSGAALGSARLCGGEGGGGGRESCAYPPRSPCGGAAAGGAEAPGARAGARPCAYGRAAAERGAGGLGRRRRLPVRPGRVAGSAPRSKSVTGCLRAVCAPERRVRGGMELSEGSVSPTCAPSVERTDTEDINLISLTK